VPLSFSQERLWFLEQMFPGLPVHNICGVATHHGYFDAEDFYSALEFVINRHESLCSRFEALDGVPRIRIAPVKHLERIQLDLSEMPLSGARDESVRFLSLHARRAFDLVAGPPIRAVVVRLSEQEHRVMICMHHIASDGWSTSILIREVLAAYDQLSDGRRPVLADLPLQYGDFSLWQRQRMTGPRLKKHMDYWVEQLRDLPFHLDLPTDKSRTAERNYSGTRVPIVIPESSAAQLFALAGKEGATPFVALLAIYAMLLNRYCGQEDFSIGIPVAGRDAQHLSGLVGCFINLVPARCDLSGNPTFRQFLARTREIVLSALEHSEVPFELIVNRIRPERDANFSPVFQVTFSFEREPTEGVDAATRAKVEFEEVNFGVSRYDLALELTHGDHGVRGWIDFSTELFEPSTVEAFVRHFNQLVESAIAYPDREIANLEVMSKNETDSILAELNSNSTDYPREATISELFEEQARSRPSSVALIEGQREVTYAQLQDSVHRFAARLLSLGPIAGTIVAICMDRSVDAIVAILGILEAGAAYVPCDPAQPRSRTEHVLNETEATTLVCDEAHRALFEDMPGVKVIILGGDR